MTARSLLLAALVLAGCAGDTQTPPDDPADCPEWFRDADGDGFGDAKAHAVVACEAPAGHVDNADDCDDGRADVHPDAQEVCDEHGVDEDCSGAADDDDPGAIGKIDAWPDADGDGFGDATVEPTAWCALPEGWVEVADDCDDGRADVHPDAQEVCDDEDVDEDCSGLADDEDEGAIGKVEAWPDADGDGYGDASAGSASYCDVPAGWSMDATDCDDARADVNPGAIEVCDDDDVDEDCSGQADDDDPNVTGRIDTWVDADGDGYGDDALGMIAYCDVPAGRSPQPGDCDDARADVNPGAVEVCDDAGVDEDCSGLADDDDPGATGKVAAWPDHDGDGFGNDALPTTHWCEVPDYMVTVPGDCDDTLAEAYPGAAWLEDPAACMVDTDGDGWGDPEPPGAATPGTDCEPDDPAVHPGALDDTFDGVDQDCNGFDGPALTDDFELQAFDPAVWASVTGDVLITPAYAGQGVAAVDFFGAGGALETHALDTSSCELVVWSFLGMQGGAGAPEQGDRLYVEYFDGVDWHRADTWKGGLNDGVWYARRGVIPWPAAFHGGFKLRLVADANDVNDHFYVDAFGVGCAADRDGDGVADDEDCAPDDPRHWADCGACLDADGDHYGVGCDLGEDCDDGDASAHPRAADPEGDGRDQDCSGVDGRGIVDDFEGVGLPSWIWSRSHADVSLTQAYAASGAQGLHLVGGDSAVLLGVTHDLGACAGIAWSYMGKRGPSRPNPEDVVRLEVLTDTGWAVLDAWVGGATDAAFSERAGAFHGAGLDTTNLQLRFVDDSIRDITATPADPSGDDWFVDDLTVVCAP